MTQNLTFGMPLKYPSQTNPSKCMGLNKIILTGGGGGLSQKTIFNLLF